MVSVTTAQFCRCRWKATINDTDKWVWLYINNIVCEHWNLVRIKLQCVRKYYFSFDFFQPFQGMKSILAWATQKQVVGWIQPKSQSWPTCILFKSSVTTCSCEERISPTENNVKTEDQSSTPTTISFSLFLKTTDAIGAPHLTIEGQYKTSWLKIPFWAL